MYRIEEKWISLKDICSKTKNDRVGNLIISERCGCELNIIKKVKRRVLRWFRNVEIMGEERIVKSLNHF